MNPKSGQIANFVMLDGSVRPFVVVQVWPDSEEHLVNGILLRDGPNDDKLDGGKGQAIMWKPSVKYDALKRANTWHEAN